jgi:hypothetical protein
MTLDDFLRGLMINVLGSMATGFVVSLWVDNIIVVYISMMFGGFVVGIVAGLLTRKRRDQTDDDPDDFDDRLKLN